MKIFFKSIIILFLALGSLHGVFATGATSESTSSSDESIKVKVSERIPGANCSPSIGACPQGGCTCIIQPGFQTVEMVIGQVIKWFTAIVALAGVLFIVVNGMMLSMNGGDKDKIKGRIKETISGLILLLLTGVILSVVAPWIYR